MSAVEVLTVALRKAVAGVVAAVAASAAAAAAAAVVVVVHARSSQAYLLTYVRSLSETQL